MLYKPKEKIIGIVQWDGKRFSDYPLWLADAISRGVIQKIDSHLERPAIFNKNKEVQLMIAPGMYVVNADGEVQIYGKDLIDCILERLDEKNMSYNDAFLAMKAGKFVARKSWRHNENRSKFLSLVKNDGVDVTIKEYNQLTNHSSVWNPTVGDLLGKDWEII